MTNPRLEDHVVGLELQLVELVEQRERADVQNQPGDAARIQQEIDALQEEIARTAEVIARPDADLPEFHDLAEAGEVADSAPPESPAPPDPHHPPRTV